MKKLLLITFSLFTALVAVAQSKITVKGLIADSSTHKPLSYITVALTDSATRQPVKSGLTQDDGTFTLTAGRKAYLLTVIAVGYQAKVVNLPHVDTLSASVINLGTITVTPATSQLKEVAITATRPLVKQEIDRVSYDVQADPDNKALTAMDMLRRVPLVTADGDDNIQLQGSSSYRIFINGKPSALMTSSPKDVLRSMPANTIQRIEVITTPPAKYDSEGLAGIINIITFKKTTDGYNGTATTRYNTAWGSNFNMTGTVKQNKFGVSGFAGTGHQNHNTIGSANFRETFSTQQPGLVTSRFVQEGSNTYGGNFLYGSAELSYEADSLNLFTASLNYNKGRFNQDFNRTTQFNPLQALPQSYELINDGGFDWAGTDIGLNYQIGFKRNKQQLLTTSYRYSYASNGQFSTISAINRLNYTQPDYDQQNNAGSKEHTFQLDYVHPVKQLTIEAGAKAIIRNNFSDGAGNTLLPQGPTDNPASRNNFDYSQDVYSLYNSYQLKLAQWSFKGGVRAEHTRIDANFVTNNTGLNMNYTNVVPSLSVMRNFKNNQTLTFGYTNRLERPYIQQLNPFIDRTNTQLYNTGNPNLRPVLSYLTELTYTKSAKGSISTKVSYLYTGNSIINATSLLNDTSISTYANAGRLKVIRLNINGNFPVTSKLNVNFNTGLFHVDISGNYGNRFYSNSGLRTNTSANASYKLTDNWQLGASGGYNRRYINLQGSSNDYYYTSLSTSKTFFNKNATLTVTANNPFQKFYAFTQYTDTPEFYQSNTGNQIYRTFSASFSYKFGRLSSDIKKNQRSINNDDKSTGAQ